MKRKMGFKGFLFILPALILIGIFSLWPVLQSFTYTFFDYRLNDQQKSGLYLSERFNTDLYNETAFYVGMFLEQELPNITDPEDVSKVEQTVEQLREMSTQYEEQELEGQSNGYKVE